MGAEFPLNAPAFTDEEMEAREKSKIPVFELFKRKTPIGIYDFTQGELDKQVKKIKHFSKG